MLEFFREWKKIGELYRRGLRVDLHEIAVIHAGKRYVMPVDSLAGYHSFALFPSWVEREGVRLDFVRDREEMVAVLAEVARNLDELEMKYEVDWKQEIDPELERLVREAGVKAWVQPPDYQEPVIKSVAASTGWVRIGYNALFVLVGFVCVLTAIGVMALVLGG